ncbi:hypothetical protein MP228_011647 [Amoeboaphelidium protococcarum]|nr:hypothetical protein MP228_011647 [Amoeboaphelidium protococcarum]
MDNNNNQDRHLQALYGVIDQPVADAHQHLHHHHHHQQQQHQSDYTALQQQQQQQELQQLHYNDQVSGILQAQDYIQMAQSPLPVQQQQQPMVSKFQPVQQLQLTPQLADYSYNIIPSDQIIQQQVNEIPNGTKGWPQFIDQHITNQILALDPASNGDIGAFSGQSLSLDRVQPVDLSVLGRIEGGFFVHEDCWTCYRRNYFHVCAALHMASTAFQQQLSHSAVTQEPDLYINLRDDGSMNNLNLKKVKSFDLDVGVKSTAGFENKATEIVAHGVKRNGKACKVEPQAIVPSYHPSQMLNAQLLQAEFLNGSAGIGGQNSPEGPNGNLLAFQRLQFRHATANNGKRRAIQQRYMIVMTLYANMEDGSRVEVTRYQSEEIVVRGRSPGHYAEQEQLKEVRRYSHFSSPRSSEHTITPQMNSSELSSALIPPVSAEGGHDYVNAFLNIAGNGSSDTNQADWMTKINANDGLVIPADEHLYEYFMNGKVTTATPAQTQQVKRVSVSQQSRRISDISGNIAL